LWAWMSDLRTIVLVLQEQTALTRELIQALTHRPAQTTPSRISGPTRPALPPHPRQSLPRTYTAADVTVVTPEVREQQAIQAFEQQHRSWRIQDLPPDVQAAVMASMPAPDDPPTPRPPTTTPPR